MSNVYPTIQALIDLDNDGVPETDMRQYIAGNIECDGGLKTNKETDRLASVGTLKCDLRDDDASSSWISSNHVEGRAIQLAVTYQGRTKSKWFGHVAPQTKLPSSGVGQQQGSITATDWIQTANETVINNLPPADLQRADQAINTLITLCPVPPANVDIDTGTETFPSVFDGATKNTVVYSELDRIVKSELGYLYLRQSEGETLRFENRLTRGSTVPLATIPTAAFRLKYSTASDSGYLQYLTAVDSGKLQAFSQQNAIFDRTMTDSVWTRGESVINEMTVTRVPGIIDASDVVLWKTDQRMQIGFNTKFTINGTWHRTDGGNLIRAHSWVTPVIGTDVILTENQDGTGTDYSSTLSSWSWYWNPSVAGFSATFRSSQAGWLYMQVRGKGVYKDNPIDYWVESQESKTDFVRRVKKESITREYSNDANTTKHFGDYVIALNRHPNKDMKTVSFIANSSEDLLLAFMYLDIGDKVKIIENKPSHTGYYYIQGYKFSITPGGLIFFTWYLKEDAETLCTPIAVTAPTVTDVATLDFGILSHLADLSYFSYSAWIRRDNATQNMMIVSHLGDVSVTLSGNYFQSSNSALMFSSVKSVTTGLWTASACLTGTGVWQHVVVTYDNTTDTANPIIYVDGSSVTVTETIAPSGTTKSDANNPLVLFNLPFGTGYTFDSKNVSIKDIRIYDHILTQQEVTDLYNGEDDYTTVPIGKLFQGIYAPTENIADYTSTTLEDEDLVLDTVHGIVGTPYHETNMLTGESI